MTPEIEPLKYFIHLKTGAEMIADEIKNDLFSEKVWMDESGRIIFETEVKAPYKIYFK